MTRKQLAAACLAFVAFSSLCYSDEGDQHARKWPLLARLSPPQDDLPPNCRIQEIPDYTPELKQLKNRAVSTEPKLFLIADDRLKKLIDPETINASYFGIYREKNECGIVGWAFTSVENSKKAHKAMVARYINQKKLSKLWQIDEYVVWLWRDPGTTDECFHSLERYLDSQLKKQGKPSAK